MKRFILMSILTLTSLFAITSCTEESVEPRTESDAAPGGGAIDPIVK